MASRILYLLVSALLAVTANASVIKRDTWSARIVDGLPAGVGEFPHQALVVAEDASVWGGSLITTTAVLTTATCTLGHKSWTIRLGGIHRTEAESTAWTAVSITAVAHPEFNTSAYNSNDVAILFLPREAPLNYYINTVALPSRSEADDSFAGQSAILSGWGNVADNVAVTWPDVYWSELLLWTVVTVVPNDACAQLYSSNYSGYIIESTLCAGNENAAHCFGDTGGALVLKTEAGYEQIGVASFFPGGTCETPLPAAYTRITSFLDWITTTANIET